jgi:DNA replication protein DnaC
MKQKIIDLSYNSSNLNTLRDATFEKYDLSLYSNKKPNEKDLSPRENSKKLLDIAKDFVKNFDNGTASNLLFAGSSGTGKTFLSSCIANELIKNGHTVLYQTAPLLLDKIFDYKYGDNTKNAKELYDNVYNVDLLIIDDLGTENQTGAKFAELFNIINARILEQNKKTIISSNFDLQKLSEMYDHRLISRLIGNFSICRFYGEDIRLKNS